MWTVRFVECMCITMKLNLVGSKIQINTISRCGVFSRRDDRN